MQWLQCSISKMDLGNTWPSVLMPFPFIIMFHLSFFQIYFYSYLAYLNLISNISWGISCICLGWGGHQGSPVCLSTSRQIPASVPLPKAFIPCIYKSEPLPSNSTQASTWTPTIHVPSSIYFPPSCWLCSLSLAIVPTHPTPFQMSISCLCYECHMDPNHS